jgi:hypothetical protein
MPVGGGREVFLVMTMRKVLLLPFSAVQWLFWDLVEGLACLVLGPPDW